MSSVAIVGVTGYGGGELARLLARHPEVEVTQVVSDSSAGKPLASAFPGLAGTKLGALVCEKKGGELTADIVFLAQENGYAMTVAGEFLAQGKRVIDLSADFRLTDTAAWTQFYKMPPAAPELLAEAVYGMPELVGKDKIAKAKLIANPGCYVTASSLALAPLVKHHGLSGIIIDAKSGVSGAGRSKSDTIYRYAEMNETVRPYAVGGSHRHTPEIEQNIGAPILFTPHLVPMTRGILATCYGQTNASAAALTETLKAAYADCPFVVVREPGDWPSTKDVAGSNFCHLAVASTGSQAIVVSVIDNLVKGAAGQAIHNMNIMLGYDETAGLEGGGLWP